MIRFKVDDQGLEFTGKDDEDSVQISFSWRGLYRGILHLVARLGFVDEQPEVRYIQNDDSSRQ